MQSLPLCGAGKLVTNTSWGSGYKEGLLFPGEVLLKAQQNLSPGPQA